MTPGTVLADGWVVHRVIPLADGRLLVCSHDPVPNAHGMLAKRTENIAAPTQREQR